MALEYISISGKTKLNPLMNYLTTLLVNMQEELAARYSLSRPSAAVLPLSPGPVVKADERNGASQEALTTGERAVGCVKAGGGGKYG